MATIDLVVNSNGVTVLNQTTAAAEGTAEAVKSLNQQYTALKKQQEQFKPNTKEFKELTDQMVELKKQMKESADAVAQNTQPAVEGLRGTFATMKEQVMNFNFEGLTESLKSFTANLGRVNVSSITGSLKAMLAAGVQGFKTLGNVIKQNPIFLVAGLLIGIISYWKEISDLVSGKSKMLESLNKQLDTLKSQEQTLTRQLALQRALGAGGGQILKTELDILKNKQYQAEAAMKIAILEEDKAKFLEAQQAQLTAINDLEIRKIKVYQDTKALLDKIRAGKDDEYNKQLLQNEAFSVYKNQTEQIALQQHDINAQSTDLALQMQRAQQAGNAALVEKLRLQREGLLNHVKDLQSQKDEIWNAGMAAKSEVKTEKELERIAASKAKQAERKSAADAAAKKLADDILAIEKSMLDVTRSLMPDKEREILLLEERQKQELATFTKAKKNETEIAELKKSHATELKIINDKYAKAAQDILDEQALKEKEAAAARLEEKKKEIADLQAVIDAADKGNIESTATQQERDLIASQEYYLTLKEQAKAAGLDATALVEEQARKENEIKEKYRKEDEANRMANIQAGFEMASLGLDALMDLNQAAAKGDEASQRKAFERNKLMQKAQATIAMASGIVQQLAVPQDQLTGMNFAKAAAVAAAGIANIVKINQTQFGGGGSGGGNGNLNEPTGGGANAPAVDFSGANMQVNAPGSTETYVLAGNVANALEARQKIIDQSHL